jgi:hypothetical protein
MSSTVNAWPHQPDIHARDQDPIGQTLDGSPIYCGVACCTVNGLTFRRVATSTASQAKATAKAVTRVRDDYRQHLRDLGLVR